MKYIIPEWWVVFGIMYAKAHPSTAWEGRQRSRYTWGKNVQRNRVLKEKVKKWSM